MLNHIVLMGRLTRDPELRRTASGVSVASFSLAVDRDFGNRETGERETDFIDIVAWRSTAEFVSKYFSKGPAALRLWQTTSPSATPSATTTTAATTPATATAPAAATTPAAAMATATTPRPASPMPIPIRRRPLRPFPPAISLCSRTTTASSRSKNFSHDTVKKEDPCYGE